MQKVEKSKKQRLLQISGAIIAAIALLGVIFSIFSAWRLVDKAFPFLTSHSTVYLQFPADLSENDWFWQKQLISEAFKLTNDDLLIVDTLFASSGQKKGLFIRDNQLFVYTEGQFYLQDQSENSFRRSVSQVFGHEYQLLSFHDYERKADWSLSDLKKKQKLLDFLGKNGSIVVMQPGEDFFSGLLTVSDNHIVLDIADSSEKIGTMQVKKYRKVPFQSYNSAKFAAVPHTISLESTDILQRLLISGDVIASNPKGLESDKDLFSSYHWEFKGKMAEYEAKELIESILNYLGEEYPEVISRILPDNSAIFELQKSTEQFLQPGQVLKPLESGLITYHHGQIRFEYLEGELRLVQGSLSPSSESVDNSCYFDSAELYGHIEYLVLGDSLWKSSTYALGSQRLLICSEKKSQLIHKSTEESSEQDFE